MVQKNLVQLNGAGSPLSTAPTTISVLQLNWTASAYHRCSLLPPPPVPFSFPPTAFLECPSDQLATILFIFRDSVKATSPHESFPNSSQANAINQS